jgi:hypothetical protein
LRKAQVFVVLDRWVRLRFEFAGVKVLGAGGKISRTGWSQPPVEVVVGAVISFLR